MAMDDATAGAVAARRMEPAAAAEAAAAADAAACAALARGDLKEVRRSLLEAEARAFDAGVPALKLRQAVRAFVLAPEARRQAWLEREAGRPLADLLAIHAADLLAARHPAAARPEAARAAAAPAAQPQGRLLAAVSAAALLSVAGVVAVPVLVSPTVATQAPVAGGSQMMAVAEAAIGTLGAVADIAKAVAYDPLANTLAAAAALSEATGAGELAAEAAVLLLGTGMGPGLLLGALLLAACALLRAVVLHLRSVRTREGDRVVFVGRQLWYSFHRRLVLPPLAATGGALAAGLGAPGLAMPFHLAATAGLVALLWLAMPGARPRLWVIERPGEPRQTRIEVLGGVLRVRHVVFAAYDLRSAARGPTPWWSPSDDIVLTRADGREVLLKGFAGPHRAGALVDDINRLIRDVPPMPFAYPPAPPAR